MWKNSKEYERMLQKYKSEYVNVFRFKNMVTWQSYLVGTDKPLEVAMAEFAEEQGVKVNQVGFWIFQGKGSEYCA